MDSHLWSRAAVGELIEQEFGIALQVRCVGKYLTRWGVTPQKPIKRAYEQSPAAVYGWLEGEYPTIEARARAQGAEIHWGDETAFTIRMRAGEASRLLAKLLWRWPSVARVKSSR